MKDLAEVERTFSRDVWCVLGLPLDRFDTVEEVCSALDGIIAKKEKCILSTPNLNFVRLSVFDGDFRNSIISSNMNIVDGEPLLWVSRLLGLPVTRKISGSEVVLHIIEHRGSSNYRLFFFGGRDGAAKKAFETVNALGCSVRAVGYFNPGDGSAEDMSGQGAIQMVNDSAPDILLISLGARKAMSWIARNAGKIRAYVISDVGATINFISGKIKRAPEWMRRGGLEWLWRALQEPRLFSRYFLDGVMFVFLFSTRVVPYKFFLLFCRSGAHSRERQEISLTEDESCVTLSVSGVCNRYNSAAVRDYFKRIALINKDAILDARDLAFIDNSFLGLLLLLSDIKIRQGLRLVIENASFGVKMSCFLNCCYFEQRGDGPRRCRQHHRRG